MSEGSSGLRPGAAQAGGGGACALCERPGVGSTVRRDRLPAMQNYVFRDREAARAARSGRLDLGACPACGFAHNVAFDPALLAYDAGYDNTVPSTVMTAYYRELAAHLHDAYALDRGLVVDVGCGKGTFLQVVCDLSPHVRGLGIDPSYEGDEEAAGGRLRFIRDVFAKPHIRERPAVVVCRHVLEHIPRPVSFLRSLHDALGACPGTPVFLEVPDTNWIIRNGAFWDFCYEHCNYFTPHSLSQALTRSGFAPPHAWRTAFGDQYIWMESTRPGDGPGPLRGAAAPPSGDLAAALAAYAEGERALMSGIRAELAARKAGGGLVAIWGMATKGIVFSFLVDGDRTLIDFCVDINRNKQGGFVPLAGHRIEAPDVLRQAGSRPLALVVMNPNYLAEIRDTCAALSLHPVFMDASGRRL